jgi:hypothetical protein
LLPVVWDLLVTHIAPDPHPGRCLNIRRDPASNTMMRCLDYDGTQHVCTFPTQLTPGTTIQTGIYSTPPPVPWVKPEVAE